MANYVYMYVCIVLNVFRIHYPSFTFSLARIKSYLFGEPHQTLLHRACVKIFKIIRTFADGQKLPLMWFFIKTIKQKVCFNY